jgi:hypothetical protein
VGRLRRIRLALRIGGLIVVVLLRLIDLYSSLRIRLWYRRWRYRRKFVRKLRLSGLPEDLVGSLIQDYEEYLKRSMKLPGARELAGYSYKWRHKGRRVSRT